MSSGLAAPIPQIPRPYHDLLDPDSWPARQLETSLARLQSVQAVLKNTSYDMGKAAVGGGLDTLPQTKKTAGTYPRPVHVVDTVTAIPAYEAAIDAALVAVTTAVAQVRTALAL